MNQLENAVEAALEGVVAIMEDDFDLIGGKMSPRGLRHATKGWPQGVSVEPRPYAASPELNGAEHSKLNKMGNAVRFGRR
ncbi:MAG: hypothetical protein ACOY4G_01620 [Pseudomonadota bacterium]